MAEKRFDVNELRSIRENWNDIPSEVIPEKYREIYIKRKKAVDMYIDGYSTQTIFDRTGIGHNHITEFILKCITMEDEGFIGYQGLIPYTRITPKPQKESGNFSKLIKTYPTLKDFIAGNFFGDKKYTLEKNMNLKTLHNKFLSECLKLGIQQHEYPFNTSTKGYVSLCKYVKTLQKENISKQAERESKDNRQKLLSTGIGKRYTHNALIPFSVVQVDGHIMDIQYNVEIYNTDGTISKIVATRAWLFAVIDVATRCILGFSVSQEFNYNQYDVIEAIKNAIVPRERMAFTTKGFRYPENGGYYSLAFPELRYVLFDTLMLDNAKSHLAEHTVNKIVDELKCSINYGSVATPETRGIIERFFGGLETRGFHKLPSTTGSNIRDLKRREPEKAAVKYDITYDEILELLEVLIAEYNNTPHSGLDNLTPLESMRKKIFEAGMSPTLADASMMKAIEQLDYRTTTRKVVGGKNGKRAYINFLGSEYRSNELSLTGTYIGQTITIIYNPRDISYVEAYTKNGLYIGTLIARGEFGTKSHSVKTRKNVKKFARERGREKLEFDTPITAYEQSLYDKGKKDRRSATKADIVRREQGKDIPSVVKQQETVSTDISKLKPEVQNAKDLKYDDIKDLDAYALYKIMFGS